MFDWKSTRPIWPHLLIACVLLTGIVVATHVLAHDLDWTWIDAGISAGPLPQAPSPT